MCVDDRLRLEVDDREVAGKLVPAERRDVGAVRAERAGHQPLLLVEDAGAQRRDPLVGRQQDAVGVGQADLLGSERIETKATERGGRCGADHHHARGDRCGDCHAPAAATLLRRETNSARTTSQSGSRSCHWPDPITRTATSCFACCTYRYALASVPSRRACLLYLRRTVCARDAAVVTERGRDVFVDVHKSLTSEPRTDTYIAGRGSGSRACSGETVRGDDGGRSR